MSSDYIRVARPRASTAVQRNIFTKALQIYEDRNNLYHDNWRRFGWRGCMFRIRERSERAWDALWDAPAANPPQEIVDDLLDLMNFAAFCIRAIEEGNRDGQWWSQTTPR